MKSVSSKSPVPLTPPNQGKKSTLSEIQLLEKNREERRKQMEASKRNRANEEQRNRDNGTPGDVDFQRMIRSYRESAPPEQVHFQSMEKICICVRKRPISANEVKKIDHDSVSCHHPLVAVHDCKLKVDGITKYLDNTLFHMDHTFHEENSTADVYVAAVEPLIDFVMDGGRATVFAYVGLLSSPSCTCDVIVAFHRVKLGLVKHIPCREYRSILSRTCFALSSLAQQISPYRLPVLFLFSIPSLGIM